jgi:adenosylhomocysteinase
MVTPKKSSDAIIADPKLAESGRRRVEWAERQMPVLLKVRERFARAKPFKGVRICACLHVTKETAVLARTLKAGGAEVALAASNPLSTQDDAAAALAAEGVKVFAFRGQSNDQYYECLNACLDHKPQITIDDGADLISALHSKRTELLRGVWGGQEETTTGVIRLRAMARDGALKYPVVAVNDTPTKHLIDNVTGTGQSTLDGILRATNILLAGSNFVVVGYGHCGKGVAKRADGMGAKVIVVEVNPLEALRAHFDGFRVMGMREAASIGDIFVTVTGNKNVIRAEHLKLMKDGAIVANSGHFNVEIDIPALANMAKHKREVRPNTDEYTLPNNRRLYLLAEGRLVNLAAAEGHPSAVMDLSFANQALVSEWLAAQREKLKAQVYDVPTEIDHEIARLKLEAHGLGLEKLTPEQLEYLASWKEGT